MDDIGVDSKIVILGCTDVGKTSITMRYCHNSFSTPTSATIGASFLQKRIVIEDVRMTLQLWDTAGQERFRSMAPMYYRNAKAAILVFDLNKDQSFEKVQEWLHDLRKHVESDIVLAVVGNKCDTPNASNFDFRRAEDFAQEIGATSHRTSAKTGSGIQELFQDVSKRLLLKHRQEELQRSQFEFNPDEHGDGFILGSHNSKDSNKKCC